MNGLHIKVSINTIHLIYEGSSNLEYIPNMCIGTIQHKQIYMSHWPFEHDMDVIN